MKLQLNEDGSIGLPLRIREGGNQLPVLMLPEPDVEQLTEITLLIDKADQAVGEVPTVDRNMTAAQLLDAQRKLRLRTMTTYGTERPYLVALLDIVKMLTDVQLEPRDLPGWAANPKTCNELLSHFQDPLPGPALNGTA